MDKEQIIQLGIEYFAELQKLAEQYPVITLLIQAGFMLATGYYGGKFVGGAFGLTVNNTIGLNGKPDSKAAVEVGERVGSWMGMLAVAIAGIAIASR